MPGNGEDFGFNQQYERFSPSSPIPLMQNGDLNFACAVTFPLRRGAGARNRKLSVRPQYRLGVDAPEVYVVRARHFRVTRGLVKHLLVAQAGTEFRMLCVVIFGFVYDHRVPPFAAARMARLTETLASWIL